jgi:FkbM family methyltransferase
MTLGRLIDQNNSIPQQCRIAIPQKRFFGKLIAAFHLSHAHISKNIFYKTDAFLKLCVHNTYKNWLYAQYYLLHVDNENYPRKCFEDFIYFVNKLPHIQNTLFIVDAGANVGDSTIVLAKKYPHAEILIIEPIPDMKSYILSNLVHNNIHNEIRYLEAVLTKDGPMKKRWLYIPKSTQNASLQRQMIHQDLIRYLTKISPITVSLKQIVQYKKIDILKIDIEGGEFELLSDLIKNAKSIQYICMEIHYRKSMKSTHKIFMFLSKLSTKYNIIPDTTVTYGTNCFTPSAPDDHSYMIVAISRFWGK